MKTAEGGGGGLGHIGGGDGSSYSYEGGGGGYSCKLIKVIVVGVEGLENTTIS